MSRKILEQRKRAEEEEEKWKEKQRQREKTLQKWSQASPGERPARDPGPDMPVQTKRVQVQQWSFSQAALRFPQTALL